MDYPSTQYAEQRRLEIVTQIPEMMYNAPTIDITPHDQLTPIPTGRKVAVNNFEPLRGNDPYSNYCRSQQILHIVWTHDDDNIKNTTTTNTTCNTNLPPGTEGQYSYNCVTIKLCYFLPADTPLENFNFNFESKPEYSVVPYRFNHQVIFFGQTKNLFNMYISLKLVLRFERILAEWGNSLGIELVRNGGYGPRQLITQVRGGTESEIKIQLCVQDEYFYWAVETLLRNYRELVERGMFAFKFIYLIGESKIYSISETFPDIEPTGPIETYVQNGQTYRRELLTSPNIVIYLNRSVSNISGFVSKLIELFPDEHNISSGVPRFNIRINNNIFFSTGGGNEHKFVSVRRLTEGFTPTEYAILKRQPELYPTHALFSRYLTGHDVIEGDHINNIQSYKYMFNRQASFKQEFERVGLGEIYNNIFTKFGIPSFESLYPDEFSPSTGAESVPVRAAQSTPAAEESSSEDDTDGGFKPKKNKGFRFTRVSKSHKRTKKNRMRRTWSLKYKRSINCKRPKGFSQKQHCKYGRKNKM